MSSGGSTSKILAIIVDRARRETGGDILAFIDKEIKEFPPDSEEFRAFSNLKNLYLSALKRRTELRQ